MDGFAAYHENAVATQSRGRIVVLLYEGAIKFLRRAVEELKAGRHVEKAHWIGKALDIINELDASLDMEVGGEMALNLRRLYVFMIRQLNHANLQNDPQRIEEVVSLLSDLNEGWKAVAG
jgi:flagellar protein FliS